MEAKVNGQNGQGNDSAMIPATAPAIDKATLDAITRAATEAVVEAIVTAKLVLTSDEVKARHVRALDRSMAEFYRDAFVRRGLLSPKK